MADVSEEHDFLADSILWAFKATKSIVFCLSFTQSRLFFQLCFSSSIALPVYQGCMTFEFIGDARLYRAASGGMMGWVSCQYTFAGQLIVCYVQ
jgi:hypothetical protein